MALEPADAALDRVALFVDTGVEGGRAAAAQRGYDITRRYTISDSAYDAGPGYKATMAELLADAHAGHFDVLVVWAADRLCREGIEALLRVIRMLRERNVALISVQEPWLSGSDETTELLAAVAAWVANQESKRRSARVKAGLARRKAEGLPVGRQAGARDAKPRRRAGYVARWDRARANASAVSPAVASCARG